MNDNEIIKSLIRAIPDYPKVGIMFRDVTTLLKDNRGLGLCVKGFKEHYKNTQFDYIAGIESRGFIIGAALAFDLGIGFIPIRKKGKLPADVISKSYKLEYGEDTLEIHKDSIESGKRVLLIDDLLATGGTALAAKELILELGAVVEDTAFIVDLPALNGSQKLSESGLNPFSLVKFEGE